MIYAKDCDLYYMSIADYQRARKDEKDSTIVEVRLTMDGTPDFGYGIPYSTLNTDTLCNGKRRGVWGYWSPDSKYFATIIADQRNVKPLWVINSIAELRLKNVWKLLHGILLTGIISVVVVSLLTSCQKAVCL